MARSAISGVAGDALGSGAAPPARATVRRARRSARGRPGGARALAGRGCAPAVGSARRAAAIRCRFAVAVVGEHPHQPQPFGAGGAQVLLQARRGARHHERRLAEREDLAERVVAAHGDHGGGALEQGLDMGLEGERAQARLGRDARSTNVSPLLGRHERPEQEERARLRQARGRARRRLMTQSISAAPSPPPPVVIEDVARIGQGLRATWKPEIVPPRAADSR